MAKYEIAKQLTLSTAHIPQWIAQELDKGRKNSEPKVSDVIFDLIEHGYRIYAGGHALDMRAEWFPAELRELVDLAKSLDCEWLVLDCDGQVRDDLPKWEW